MGLSTQIKATRERLGLSQSQAAKAWGVPKQNLKNWEAGRNAPRGQTLQRLWPILFPESDTQSRR
ncbi:MAG: helix-turn-helix domain-containing protein [Opitutaceae bacterium]|nr:helix-turn-helix domain-containing protein [Opitutaceae bacterium]